MDTYGVEKEIKSLCLGNSIPEVVAKCDQWGSIDAHEGEMVAVGVGEELSEEGEDGDDDNLPAVGSEQEVKVLSESGLGSNGEWRELRNLNADLLVEVFSSLPQEDLLEVLAVCRHWEKAVRKGSVVWQHMRVHQEWRRESTQGERERGRGGQSNSYQGAAGCRGGQLCLFLGE